MKPTPGVGPRVRYVVNPQVVNEERTPEAGAHGSRTDASNRWRSRIVVPLMLSGSSLIMAFAWLGHLKLKQLPHALAILLAWLLVLPEYGLNIRALRMGYGPFSGGQMAAFRLSSGVVSVALVSRFVLGEELGWQKLLGFGLMIAAMVLIAKSPYRPTIPPPRDDEGG